MPLIAIIYIVLLILFVFYLIGFWITCSLNNIDIEENFWSKMTDEEKGTFILKTTIWPIFGIMYIALPLYKQILKPISIAINSIITKFLK